jgi:hypothetical protein
VFSTISTCNLCREFDRRNISTHHSFLEFDGVISGVVDYLLSKSLMVTCFETTLDLAIEGATIAGM